MTDLGYDMLNACHLLPWSGVYFVWISPAHSCGTDGADGNGCVSDGWHAD